MKVKLLVNFTCNRLKLKKDHVIEDAEMFSIMEVKYSIDKLVKQGIIEILENDIVEEITSSEQEVSEAFDGIIIEEKKSKKSKKR